MSTKMRAINTVVAQVKDGEGQPVSRSFEPNTEFEVDAKAAKFLAENGAAVYLDKDKQKAVEAAPDRSLPAQGNKSQAAIVTGVKSDDAKAVDSTKS